MLDFGAGEPDFATPAAVNAAAKQAIDQNFSKYTPVSGHRHDLKAAICAVIRPTTASTTRSRKSSPSAGGKQALYNTALALFGPWRRSDHARAMHWPTLTEQVKLADATPVLVQTAPRADSRSLRHRFIAAMTPRTRGVIVNTPCNPTGAVMPEAELRGTRAQNAHRGIWLIVDFCYEKLVYDGVSGQRAGGARSVVPRPVRDLRVGHEGRMR